MFEVGFSELLLCFIVALVVLGPEKLPKLARTIGQWTGQARGYLRNLTAELDRESHLAELKKQIEETSQLMRQQQSAARELLNQVASDARQGVREVETAVTPAVDSAPPDAAAPTGEAPKLPPAP